jgi:hypothetical protein
MRSFVIWSGCTPTAFISSNSAAASAELPYCSHKSKSVLNVLTFGTVGDDFISFHISSASWRVRACPPAIKKWREAAWVKKEVYHPQIRFFFATGCNQRRVGNNVRL